MESHCRKITICVLNVTLTQYNALAKNFKSSKIIIIKAVRKCCSQNNLLKREKY